MTRALSSYPEEMRGRVAARRVSAETMGLGYWGAKGYMDKKAAEAVVKSFVQAAIDRQKAQALQAGIDGE